MSYCQSCATLEAELAALKEGLAEEQRIRVRASKEATRLRRVMEQINRLPFDANIQVAQGMVEYALAPREEIS